jgi:uncharacterized protein YbaR (Trm112 family)
VRAGLLPRAHWPDAGRTIVRACSRRKVMALDPRLVEILADPEDKGPLLYFDMESSLYNPRTKRRYAIKDDIPVMLIEESEIVADAEHQRLVALAKSKGLKPTF